MAQHRAEVRPRYGRIAVAAVSVTVTFVAVLGGTGLLPLPSAATGSDGSALAGATYSPPVSPTPTASPDGDDAAAATARRVKDKDARPSKDQGDRRRQASGRDDASTDGAPLPAASGSGRRVVFSEGQQRVWLVDEGDEVTRTYLVSGSVYDNLDPGTYTVYSRSEHATGIDGSTMDWFVRFTQGQNAAIGFHDIPDLGGQPVQTADELGTPLSHGCIRQDEDDALAMWDFAPIGTTVVVTA